MNLNNNKSVNIDAQYNIHIDRTNTDRDRHYVLNCNNVILSTYSVNRNLNILILTTDSNLVGTLTQILNGEETVVNWNSTKYTDNQALTYLLNNGGVDGAKVRATFNALLEQYGHVYLHRFEVSNDSYLDSGLFTASLTNSFYLYNGATNSGIFDERLPFNIGDGQKLSSVDSITSNTAKLLEFANGNINADIGTPENPLDPTGVAGVLNFINYSKGLGSGTNTYKLSWKVMQDTETVNYAQMTCDMSLVYKNTPHKFKTFTIGNDGSFDFTFAEIIKACGDLSVLDKILALLPVVDPQNVFVHLRCYIDNIPLIQPLIFSCAYDGGVSMVNNTENDNYANVYRLQGGNASGEDTKTPSDNDDDYKGDDESGDGDNTDYSGGTDSVNGSALLTTSYALTVAQAHAFGRWLWSGSLFGDDGLQLVNNNPIENIVACKLFPFSVSGTSTKVQLGNVQSNVDGMKLAENVARTFTFNGGNYITIPKESAYADYDFLNFPPFTIAKIYLPYLAIQELDLNELYDITSNSFKFKLKYYVDLVTGMCRAVITSTKGKNVHVFDGQIGQDVPITGSNRAQVEVGYITGGLHSAVELLSGNVFGAIDSAINTATQMYHSSTSGTPTPCNSRFDSQLAYVIVDRPDVPSLPSKFAHQNGRVCNKTLTLSNLQGYTELDNTVDLTGIRCLESEREEILSILSSGFYV